MTAEDSSASVEGRTALVTGASSGMGAAIARLLAKRGARVAIVGRDEQRLGSVAETPGIVASIVADLTVAGEPQRVVEKAVGALGGLAMLVNAAGILRPAPIDEAAETFAEEWAINLQVPYELTRIALPYLRQAHGAVLVVSSVSASKAFPEATGYCTSKGAVSMFVRSLAVEEAPNGVRVNAIAPGEIRTALNQELLKDPDYLQAVLSATPMNRIGEVADIAPAAVFLLSDDASYITGTSLAIDGGWAAQ